MAETMTVEQKRAYLKPGARWNVTGAVRTLSVELDSGRWSTRPDGGGGSWVSTAHLLNNCTPILDAPARVRLGDVLPGQRFAWDCGCQAMRATEREAIRYNLSPWPAAPLWSLEGLFPCAYHKAAGGSQNIPSNASTVDTLVTLLDSPAPALAQKPAKRRATGVVRGERWESVEELPETCAAALETTALLPGASGYDSPSSWLFIAGRPGVARDVCACPRARCPNGHEVRHVPESAAKVEGYDWAGHCEYCRGGEHGHGPCYSASCLCKCPGKASPITTAIMDRVVGRSEFPQPAPRPAYAGIVLDLPVLTEPAKGRVIVEPEPSVWHGSLYRIDPCTGDSAPLPDRINVYQDTTPQGIRIYRAGFAKGEAIPCPADVRPRESK